MSHHLENHNEKQLTRFIAGLQTTSCGGRGKNKPTVSAKIYLTFPHHKARLKDHEKKFSLKTLNRVVVCSLGVFKNRLFHTKLIRQNIV
jgi:hypothetical protein